MKIVYVAPIPLEKNELQRRGKLLKQWASADTDVDIVRVKEGPASIESMYEECLSIPAAAGLMFGLEQKGYDAAVLGCAGDPGLDAMREITSTMLIVGPGQTSFLTAAMIVHRISLLTILQSTINSGYELARKAGIFEKLASVRSIDVSVLDLANDKDATLDRIISVGNDAICRDGADVLILGCMSMGFLNVAEQVQAALKVPVINPAKLSLKTAEALVGSGMCHSKLAFSTPPKLAQGKAASIDDLMVKGD